MGASTRACTGGRARACSAWPASGLDLVMAVSVVRLVVTFVIPRIRRRTLVSDHVILDLGHVLGNEIEDVVLQHPPKEIELAQGRLH